MPMYPSRAIVTLALLAAACGGGQGGAPQDDRLNGEWELVLTVVPAKFASEVGSEPAEARGTLAFVPNRAAAKVPNFGGFPQQVGTHNLRLGVLVPGLAPRTEPPTAAGACTGDSVRVVLDPGSAEPVILRGTWQGAEVTGEWMAHQRAGIDQGGRFTLRRPPS